MKVVFHKLNYYALMTCIVSQKVISCDYALGLMGVKTPHKSNKSKPKNKKIFTKDLENIKYMYIDERKDTITIGKKYRCSGQAISNFLVENNIQLRSRGRIKKI